MGLLGWLANNWFDVFSAFGIIASLSFAGVTLRSEAKTRRIANLIALTENHRELWKDFYHTPELFRVLDPNADLVSTPVSQMEAEFVNLVIQHISSVFRAMQSDLTIKPEGIRADIREFFMLPLPHAVWKKFKSLQNSDFVEFIESSMTESSGFRDA